MDEFTNNDEIIQNNTNQILKTNENISFPENNFTEFNLESDQEISENLENIKNSEIQDNSISQKLDIDEANTTNCLALTIKEEHRIVAVKNVFIHSLKVTWKVIVSSIALHILKIFF